ncbi:MAG TPA: energy transducer TonB [Vicinamibacterales bacterium]|nr:energy transducer TonB [Vicinamibacterales bacterium]
MTEKQPPMPSTPPRLAEGPGVVSSGWLAAQSIFEHRDQRRLGPAMWASFGGHGAILLMLILAVMYRPEHVAEPPPVPDYKVVFIHQPGPGGGGGGSPAPAPPRPQELEIPKPDLQPPPIVPPTQPVVLQEPRELPQLTAPIYTNNAAAITSSGDSLISLAPIGGGGRGTGVGPGQGSGVGPGTGGGFGGGAYRPGTAGVTDPRLLRQETPRYTSEAMRAKIQGLVELEAVVLPNGTVGDVRIVKSLDARYGLDQEALRAARAWLFEPARHKGEAVSMLVTLILEFRLH